MATAQTGFDVVVVGAGNAALLSAIAAHDKGAKVVVLEKANKEMRGGNTRFTGGLFRCAINGLEDLASVIRTNDSADDVAADAYTQEHFFADFEKVTAGKYDKTLVTYLIENSLETVRWMADLGVKFEYNRHVGAAPIPGTNKIKLPPGGGLRTKGEGVLLSETLFQLIEQRGITLLYETMATGLLQDETGRVTGVKIKDTKGIRELQAGAVILGSGGFQSSPEMRTAYLGPTWTNAKVRGTRFNTGEMTRAAFTAGAAPHGEFAGCHSTPIDADAAPYGELKKTDKTNRLSYCYSVLINLDGDRFVDEGEDTNLFTYAKFGGEHLKQRGQIGFQIFDQKSVPILEKRYNTGDPVIANTLEELVEKLDERYGKIGFKKEKVLQTLNDYNASTQEGKFDPSKKDGLSTKGLRLEKTNWAVKLDQPPFVAYPSTGGITFTYGGVKVNTQAEVVDYLDRPMAGLYATGEILGGFFYGNYPGGSGLTRGAVYGRTAGNNAADFARQTAR
jgi:tricarballylate dehydrogenase